MDANQRTLTRRQGLLTLVAILVGCSTPSLGIGDPAPSFELSLFDGSNFVLADHSETVVINFWASWCIPCRTEMPAFDEFARVHPEITVIGIAVDDTEQASRAFAEELDVGYLLGIDTDDEISPLYPRVGLPTTYVIADGVLRAHFQGALTLDQLERLVSTDP